MASPSIVNPAQGQRWRDDAGLAEVLAVVQVPCRGKWCVLQRVFDSGKRGRPFLFLAASMYAGDDGWLCEDAS